MNGRPIPLRPGDHVRLRTRRALALLRVLRVDGAAVTAEAPNGEVVEVEVGDLIRPNGQHPAGLKFEAAAAAGRGVHARPAR